MPNDSTKKLAVIGQSTKPLVAGQYVYIPWTLETLDAVLSGAENSDQCKGVALMHTNDKSYWAHRIVESNWNLLTTHPVVANVEKARALNAEANGRNIYTLCEYFVADHEMAIEIAEIAPLLYFSAKISVETPLAIRQALLEFFDCLRTLLPVPVDEIFARTRNLRTNQVEPDLVTAHLRLKNGSEGQIEAHCLSAQNTTAEPPYVSVDFYGRNGHLNWGTSRFIKGREMAERPLFADSIKSYQLVDWIERSGRFDRAMSYREALK